MKLFIQFAFWSAILLVVSACAPDKPPETPVEGRWYTHEQVSRGKPLFAQHCAACHGISGDGAGPTAALLDPYPRDFRNGVFKYMRKGTGT